MLLTFLGTCEALATLVHFEACHIYHPSKANVVVNALCFMTMFIVFHVEESKKYTKKVFIGYLIWELD